MAKRPLKVAEPAQDDDVVDEAPEAVNLEGSIGEAELETARSVAKRMGWAPKEEWHSEPEKWLDAPDFLEHVPRMLAEAKSRGERAARAAAEAIEEDRRRAREEATKVIRDSEDPTERERAAQRLAENAGPHPETVAWRARNPWFDADPDAQAVAVRAVNEAAQRGLAIPEQLAEAEARVKRRFPEHFGQSEVRLSEVKRPAPPAVQQGSRAGTSTPKEKGFADIPRADREVFRSNLLKTFMSAGQSQEQAEARYARSYWRAPPPDPSERPAELWPMSPKPNIWAQRRGRTAK